MNYVYERPADPLTLITHLAEGLGESALYEDAGNGFGYERGEYARRRVICEVEENEISVRLTKREGSFTPERSSVNLELRGVTAHPQSVAVNGEEVDYTFEESNSQLVTSLMEDARELVVEVRV
jgi:alpha-glucosidase